MTFFRHGLIAGWKKLVCVGALLASAVIAQQGVAPVSLAPYYPTPMAVVEKMLELGELKPGELVYDLGSGDGRVVILAAQKFGARAVGFEIDPPNVVYSRKLIAKLELTDLATIEQKDLTLADFSKPDLLFVYLLPDSNDKIRPLIESKARKGMRIVAHDFEFREWEPEKTVTVTDTSDFEPREHKLYLYRR
jgi:SAM-dependent methyltransferase